MRLEWLDGVLETELPLPADDVQWVSGDPGRGLVATAGPAGRIFVAGPFGPSDRPAWREVPVDAGGREWLGQPLADAVADPRGDAIAVVAADPASGLADGHLVIVDPTVARAVPGSCRAGGTAARRPGSRRRAWRSRRATRATRRDSRSSISATGDTRIDGARGSPRSPPRSTVAPSPGRTATTGRIRAGPLDRALGRRVRSTDCLRIPRARLAAQILLDATGQRLGVAWLDDAGDTTAWTVYRRDAGGWAVERDGALPRGVSRAVLVSLGP